MREADPIMQHGKLFGRLLNPSARSSQQKLSKTSVTMEAGTLIGYFAERDEARRSLRELQRRGFRRAAWVHKTADGEVHIRDPFLRRRALGVILTAIVFGGLAGVASLVLHGPAPILSGSLSALAPIFAGGLIGTLLGGVWIRRSKYGVERRLLEDHARWLVSEETVLVLQAPIETLRFPAAILRESGDIPPAVFVLHPERENPIGDVRSPGVPLSPAQIQEHAQRLAMDH
ncbi:MAG: glycosyltransferase 36, partial [Deltaproteobacteria bacterium]|nr:glycosyltransferase 36 [Deltaproteobacteria bacterium]